ncbi:MAG: hypothetical protein WBN23_05635, partial [Woeseia sp.]
FIVDIDLQANVQRNGVSSAMLAQAASNFQPVDRVHPVEMFSNLTRLVALQVANEMPDKIAARGGPDLVDPLLHEVLAEVPLARPGQRQDGRKGLPLADREQLDGACRPPGGLRRSIQQIMDFPKVFRDFYHVLLRVLRYTRQLTRPGYGKYGCQSLEGETWP